MFLQDTLRQSFVLGVADFAGHQGLALAETLRDMNVVMFLTAGGLRNWVGLRAKASRTFSVDVDWSVFCLRVKALLSARDF